MKELGELLLNIPGVRKHKRVIGNLLAVVSAVLANLGLVGVIAPEWAGGAIAATTGLSAFFGTVGQIHAKKKD